MVVLLTTRLRKTIAAGDTSQEVYRRLMWRGYLSWRAMRHKAEVIAAIQAAGDAYEPIPGAERSTTIEYELRQQGWLSLWAATWGAIPARR